MNAGGLYEEHEKRYQSGAVTGAGERKELKKQISPAEQEGHIIILPLNVEGRAGCQDKEKVTGRARIVPGKEKEGEKGILRILTGKEEGLRAELGQGVASSHKGAMTVAVPSEQSYPLS